MRVGFVRNVGLAALGLAVAALAACNDDPLGFDNDQTTDIFVNPSVMVVPAGRTSKLESRAINQGLEPTFADVLVNDTRLGQQELLNVGCATVAIDPDAPADPDGNLVYVPPGLFVVTGLNGLGTCTFTLSSGGVEKDVDVAVVADDVGLTCPDVVRSGDTGTIDAALLSFDGTAIGPLDQTTDLVWNSDNADAIVVDGTGFWSAAASGSAEITATWTGTDATGTAGLVTRTGSCTITVAGGPPVSAAFADVDGDGSIGVFEVGESIDFDVLVFDALGNLTFDPAEITGITVTSSDPVVATATATREELTADEVALTVSVEALSGGVTTISGVVETTEGDLPYTATLGVAAPVLAAIAPDPAGATETLTLTGTALALTGLDPDVFINGFPAPSVTVVSPTELEVVPPLFGDGGALSVVVSLGGVLSNAVTYNQNGTWNAEDYEPDNDAISTAPPIGNPLNFVGSIDGTDTDDFFLITTTETVTFDLTMDWSVAGVDADIAVVDEGFTVYICADGATGAKPENTVCELGPGTYALWITYYSGADPVVYSVESN